MKPQEFNRRYGNARSGRGEITQPLQGDLGEYQGLTENQRYNSNDNIDPSRPRIIEGGLGTYEIPIRVFPPDFVVAVNAAGQQLGITLPDKCVGVRFVSLVPNCWININGGGQRIVKDGDVITGAQIDTLSVTTDATGTLIVQAWGL